MCSWTGGGSAEALGQGCAGCSGAARERCRERKCGGGGWTTEGLCVAFGKALTLTFGEGSLGDFEQRNDRILHIF